MDMETLACHLMSDLAGRYASALEERYKVKISPRQEGEDVVSYGFALLEEAAGKRGFRISGGELDTERMSRILLDEFRSGKLGNFTLELPEEEKK